MVFGNVLIMDLQTMGSNGSGLGPGMDVPPKFTPPGGLGLGLWMHLQSFDTPRELWMHIQSFDTSRGLWMHLQSFDTPRLCILDMMADS